MLKKKWISRPRLPAKIMKQVAIRLWRKERSKSWM